MHNEVLKSRCINCSKPFNKSAIRDHQPRTRVAYHMLQQIALVSRVNRHIYRPKPVQREPYQHCQWPIRQPAQYKVVLLYAKRLQSGSMTLDGGDQFKGRVAFAGIEFEHHQRRPVVRIVFKQLARSEDQVTLIPLIPALQSVW